MISNGETTTNSKLPIMLCPILIEEKASRHTAIMKTVQDNKGCGIVCYARDKATRYLNVLRVKGTARPKHCANGGSADMFHLHKDFDAMGGCGSDLHQHEMTKGGQPSIHLLPVHLSRGRVCHPLVCCPAQTPHTLAPVFSTLGWD